MSQPYHKNQLWIGHPEFASDPDIRREHARNQAGLEAKTQDDINVLRARFFKRMAESQALEHGQGWATFTAYDKEAAGGLIMAGEQKMALLLSAVDFASLAFGMVRIIPQIRMITNEYVDAHGVEQLLTQDFVLDGYGNAQFFTSAFTPSEKESRDMSMAAIFLARAGKIALTANVQTFTPVMAVSNEEVSIDLTSGNAPGTVMPLGRFDRPIDLDYALAKGSKMMDEIALLTSEYSHAGFM